MHWTSPYRDLCSPTPPPHPTPARQAPYSPGNVTRLVTSSGHDRRPVQTWSLEPPSQCWHLVDTIACTFGKRAVRIILECFLVFLCGFPYVVVTRTAVFFSYVRQNRFHCKSNTADCFVSFLEVTLRAYSHQTKARTNAKNIRTSKKNSKIKQKRLKNKRQISKKIFAFAFAFARSE